LKVLLVEDHPAVANASLRMLKQQFGHEAGAVSSAAEAFEVAPQVQPDVMIIDLCLPDRSGYDVARELRSQTDFAETVLIAVSGLNAENHRAEALEAGFDAIYSKPMDFSVLSRYASRDRLSNAEPAPTNVAG